MALVLVGVACGSEGGATRSGASGAGVLAVRETGIDGVVVDLVGAERGIGSLTLTLRFRNVASEPRSFSIDTGGGRYDAWQLQAGGQRWRILRDDRGEPMAPREVHNTLVPGQTHLWRGEFEVPPDSVATFDLAIPGLSEPFTNIPIGEDPGIGSARRPETVR